MSEIELYEYRRHRRTHLLKGIGKVKDKKRYGELSDAFEKVIEKLGDSQEKEIARMYFGRGESTTQIAGSLYYSEAQVKRYLKKAIKEIEKAP